MKDTAYIYGLRGPNASRYFYIGSTRHAPEDRFSAHKSLARTGKHYNRHLMHTMRKIGIDTIACDVIETCPAAQQFEREHQLINEYLANGHSLTNIMLTPHTAGSDRTDPYVVRVATPAQLLKAIEISQSPVGAAANPHHQELLAAFHEVVVAYTEHANHRLNGKLREYLEEAAELELYGHEFFEFISAAEAKETERRPHGRTNTP